MTACSLGLTPTIEVVTNVEHDHPDCYPTPADYLGAFKEFIRLLPKDGTLVVYAEKAGTEELMAEAEKAGKDSDLLRSYGRKPPKANRPTCMPA